MSGAVSRGDNEEQKDSRRKRVGGSCIKEDYQPHMLCDGQVPDSGTPGVGRWKIAPEIEYGGNTQSDRLHNMSNLVLVS